MHKEAQCVSRLQPFAASAACTRKHYPVNPECAFNNPRGQDQSCNSMKVPLVWVLHQKNVAAIMLEKDNRQPNQQQMPQRQASVDVQTPNELALAVNGAELWLCVVTSAGMLHELPAVLHIGWLKMAVRRLWCRCLCKLLGHPFPGACIAMKTHVQSICYWGGRQHLQSHVQMMTRLLDCGKR